MRRVVHLYRSGLMTGCGILADRGMSGAGSSTAIAWGHDDWRWLPRQAQCKRCWRGRKALHAPDELVTAIEAAMHEFQRIKQEHTCWHDPERVQCTCGSFSWTHPTAHMEACFVGFRRHLRERVLQENVHKWMLSSMPGIHEFSAFACAT